MKYVIGHGSQISSEQLSGIYHLRYRVFCNRLQWDIPAVELKERDGYDALDPLFITAVNRANQVVGCCRILPTTGPYMLRDTFPSLLGSSPAPQADNIWEISRFAVDKTPHHGVAFSEVPATMIAHIVWHAIVNHIDDYVFVTTVGFERLLKRMGISYERVSGVVQIGIERSVGLMMHVNEPTISAISAFAPWLFKEERRAA